MTPSESGSHNASAYYDQGNELRDLGKLQEALAAYEQAIQLDPDYADAYNGQGNALSELGRQEEALGAYKQAIRLDPDQVPPVPPLKNSSRGRAILLVGLALLIIAAASIGLFSIVRMNQVATANASATDTAIDAGFATDIAVGETATVVSGTVDSEAKYSNIPNLSDPGEPYSPYIIGKVTVISTGTIQEDKKTEAFLSPELLAQTPSELRTVILVSCNYQTVGTYNNHSPANWAHCDIAIIDKTKARVVGRSHFDGQYPPYDLFCYSEVVFCSCCDPPYKDIAAYINSLPRM